MDEAPCIEQKGRKIAAAFSKIRESVVNLLDTLVQRGRRNRHDGGRTGEVSGLGPGWS